MDSLAIRWFIAILFVAILAIVVISDLKKRVSKARKTPKVQKRPQGFRPEPPKAPQSSWKNGGRR